MIDSIGLRHNLGSIITKQMSWKGPRYIIIYFIRLILELIYNRRHNGTKNKYVITCFTKCDDKFDVTRDWWLCLLPNLWKWSCQKIFVPVKRDITGLILHLTENNQPHPKSVRLIRMNMICDFQLFFFIVWSHVFCSQLPLNIAVLSFIANSLVLMCDDTEKMYWYNMMQPH